MNIPSGPLAGRYPFVATMAVLALVPYLVLSAALSPLVPFIETDLSMSPQTLSLGLGLGNAGTPSAPSWRCCSPSICRSA